MHIDICHICTTILNTESLIFFSLNVGNFGECCKAQRVFVDQRTAQQLIFLLFVRLVEKSVTKARRRRRESSFLRQHCVFRKVVQCDWVCNVRVLTAEKQRKVQDSGVKSWLLTVGIVL